MPINAGPEYFEAEKKYLAARTKEERIAAVEEMIKTLPKHKGTEHLLSRLRGRLARIKKEKTTSAKSKPKFIIRKQGAAQVCIIGMTGSGKSSLLNALTNAHAEVGGHPYTTKEPIVGMMRHGDVQIQLIEIPSTFSSDAMSLLYNCDLILILLDATSDLQEQLDWLMKLIDEKLNEKRILIVANKSDLRKQAGVLLVSAKAKVGLEELKENVWSRLDLIRVYTKSVGKERDKEPITLPHGATVKDVTKSVHKFMLKNFAFARVFNSTKFSGRKVGLEYRLQDLDTLEIHAS